MKNIVSTDFAPLFVSLLAPIIFLNQSQISPIYLATVFLIASLFTSIWGFRRVRISNIRAKRNRKPELLALYISMVLLALTSFFGAFYFVDNTIFFFVFWLPAHLIYLLIGYASNSLSD